MKRLTGSLALVLLAGCAPAVVLAVPHSAVVQLQPRGYALAAVKRGWVPADVYEYDLNLQVKNGAGYVDLSPAATAALKPSVNTDLKASFNGLAAGQYQVQVTARGNQGGSAADTVLTATPATAALDLSGGNNASATVTVKLDAVPFDGAATGAFTPPATDGAFIDPTATPALSLGAAS